MTSRLHIRSLAVALVATGATFFAVAGGAHAATYCVSSPSCSGVSEPSVEIALATAAMTTTPDRVEIGPGTFHSDAGFVYGGAGANNSIEIVGAGAGQTTLAGNSTVDGQPALRVEGGAPSTVSDLKITAATPSDSSWTTTGLFLSGTAERVDVQAGSRSYGVQLNNASALRSSRVSIDGVQDAIRPNGVSDAGVSDTVIEAPSGNGVEASGGGLLSVSRTRIHAKIGAFAHDGGTVSLDDSLVRASYFGLDAYDAQGKATSLHATNVTVVGTGANPTGAEASASVAGGSANLTLQNSVIAETVESLVAGFSNGSASLVASHSAYDHSIEKQNAGGSIDESQANIDVTAPGFVDAGAGDYHLRADSPLVDNGSGSPFGGLGSSDVDGGGRSIDGDGDGIATPDIGAFEYAPPAPAPAPSASGPGTGGGGASAAVPPAPAAPAITAASLTNKKFAVGAARTATAARAKRGTAFKVSLSQTARVKIDIRRKSARGRNAGTLTRSAHRGANRIAFSGRIGRRALKPGRYVAVITATDASGKRSTPRTLSFTVLKG